MFDILSIFPSQEHWKCVFVRKCQLSKAHNVPAKHKPSTKVRRPLVRWQILPLSFEGLGLCFRLEISHTERGLKRIKWFMQRLRWALFCEEGVSAVVLGENYPSQLFQLHPVRLLLVQQLCQGEASDQRIPFSHAFLLASLICWGFCLCSVGNKFHCTVSWKWLPSGFYTVNSGFYVITLAQVLK